MEIRELLPASDFNKIDLHISASGYALLDPSWQAENICSPYSRLYLVESGEGTLIADGAELAMRPGYVYLVPAGLRFGYRCAGTLTKLYFHISLLKPDGYDILSSFEKIESLPYRPDLYHSLQDLFEKNSICDLMRLKQQLYELVAGFLEGRTFAQKPLASYTPLIQNTMQYIQNNLSVQLSLKTLSDRAYVSQSFLSEEFRRQVNVSIGTYIDDLLMTAAQWRLARTQDSIASISAQLGYCDPFYFSRRIKALCGEAPLQYRKKVRAMDAWK